MTKPYHKSDVRDSTPEPILHFEPINWARVADSLEQSANEQVKLALGSPLGSSGRAIYSTSVMVLTALRDAIWEGLE